MLANRKKRSSITNAKDNQSENKKLMLGTLDYYIRKAKHSQRQYNNNLHTQMLENNLMWKWLLPHRIFEYPSSEFQIFSFFPPSLNKLYKDTHHSNVQNM